MNNKIKIGCLNIACFCVFALLIMIIKPADTVRAADLNQEAETEAEVRDPEEQGADGESISLLEFGYLSTPDDDAAVTLARIYNLLLTMFYFIIIYVGYKFIMRNLRKGRVKDGFVD